MKILFLEGLFVGILMLWGGCESREEYISRKADAALVKLDQHIAEERAKNANKPPSLAQELNAYADQQPTSDLELLARQWEIQLAATPAAPGSPMFVHDSLQAEAIAHAILRQSARRHRQLLARLDSLEQRLSRLENRAVWEMRPVPMPDMPMPDMPMPRHYFHPDELDTLKLRELVQPYIRPGYVHP